VINKLNKLSEEDRTAMDLLCMKSIPFCNKKKYHHKTIDYFKEHYKVKKYQGVEWFVVNCSLAISRKYKGMTVKTSNGYWSGNKHGIGARQVKSFLDWLESNRYIDIYTGYIRGTGEFREGFATKILFTDKLIELVTELETVHDHIGSQLPDGVIVVKDRTSKKQRSPIILPDYQDKKIKMENYNTRLLTAKIDYMNLPIPLIEYFRSFLYDPATGVISGGRLYVQGGGIQTVSGSLRRKYLTINNEPVVEMDFACANPYILLTIELNNSGISSANEYASNLNDNYDPYTLDGSFIKNDSTTEYDTSDITKQHSRITAVLTPKELAVRNITKDALLIALNSRSKVEAVSAISGSKYRDTCKTDEDQRYYGLGQISSSKLLDLLAEHNDLISHHFYTGIGLVLQKYDSDIAMEVIDTVLQQGYDILCWHDSFVVQASAKDVLRKAMRDAWISVLKDDRFCVITER